MNIDQIYKLLTKNKTITVLILIFGILGSAASIISSFDNNKVSLSADILSSSKILDIREKLSNLEVFYRNKKLKRGKDNLVLTVVKLTNNGGRDISKSDFDKDDLLRFELGNGVIVELPKVIDSSEPSYLEKNLQFKFDTIRSIVSFSPIHLDEKAFVTIKILSIVEDVNEPNLSIKGKILGISKPIVLKYQDSGSELNFFQKVFIGNFFVQVVKAAFYFFIVLVLLVFAIKLVFSFNKRRKKREEKRIVEQFKLQSNYSYLKIHDVIFDLYLNGKKSFLKDAYEELTDPKMIEDYEKLVEKELKESNNSSLQRSLKNELEFYEKLATNGFLIIKEEDSIVINPKMKEALIKFVEYTNLTKEALYSYRLKRFYLREEKVPFKPERPSNIKNLFKPKNPPNN